MKPDERVSDDRLADLIAGHEKAKKTARILMPDLDTPVGDALLECLSELQSRRDAERAALPAVEEMAEKIAWNCEVATYPPAKSSATKPVITAALSPLYAKLADLEQKLSRNQNFVADQGRAIAERDAVLGECRKSVQGEGKKPNSQKIEVLE